jgi:hypothetical protein
MSADNNKPKVLVPTVADHTFDVPTADVDTTNVQLVGAHKDTIVIMKPKLEMTRREALIHAATIVALADPSENFLEFRGILKAVLET